VAGDPAARWVDGVAGAGEVRRRGSERGKGGWCGLGFGQGSGCHRGAAGVIMAALVDPSASPAGAARSVPVGRSVGWAPPVAAIITRRVDTHTLAWYKCTATQQVPHGARRAVQIYYWRIFFDKFFIVSCRARLRQENGHMGCVRRLLPTGRPFPPRLGLHLKSQYGYGCVMRFGRPVHVYFIGCVGGLIP
jgi:hypothetical protein